MAINDTHWSINRSTGDIRYIGADHGGGGAGSYATVIEFHRWLQGLADDAVAIGDDELDITNTDPSRRSTDNIITLINGYNIDDIAAEHLYDGSVIQDTGDTIYDGVVNFGNSDVQIQLHQNGVVLSDDWWNYGASGLNADATAGISHRFMVKVRTGGEDIDNRRIIGIARRWLYTFSEFPINATARGNNVLALTDALDINNETSLVTVSGWSNIVNVTEGYANIDVNNNSIDEYYFSEWNIDTQSINDLYERMKMLTRDGSEDTLYGLSGELFRGITHQVECTHIAGTFNAIESVFWGAGATSGTGQMFAIDAPGASTILWMQLLTGVVPAANTISGVSSAASTTAGAITERIIPTPFIGASTGTALISAYGFGVERLDLTSNDKVKDLYDNVITPPNNVTNTVGGLAAGEDRVLVAPWDGAATDINGDPAITKNQLGILVTLDLDFQASGVFVFDSDTAIPTDTPATGQVRITDDNGFEKRVHFDSWTGSTFTSSGILANNNYDFSGVSATAANDMYIAYIDKLAVASTAIYTSVQDSSRQLVVIVRDGGGSPIKQFISEWSQTTSAQTINAIRTTDA